MSLWEAQMVHAEGRLSLDRPFPSWLRQAAAPGVVQLVPIG
jgi:PIN domain nuclease of toxin-antitoxin system